MSVFVVLITLHLQSGLSLQIYLEKISDMLERLGVWGPLAYIVIYILRPLLFFPATLLTAISGA